MDYQEFDLLCNRLIECYQKMNDKAYYKTSPCSDEARIKAVEERIGITLPQQLREFFLNFSGCFEMYAFLPDEFCDALPKELKEIFAAQYVISLEEVENNEMIRRDWVSECFPDEDDEYDKVWHHKLGIIDVGNGDIISLDIGSNPYNPPVVYLSHEGDDSNGMILGKDFNSFLMDLILSGGCGMEDWQMMPFIPDSENGIDPNCENAATFRKLIGFDYE
ncbi:MAG: SMI1/KNR4 family protein [Oscillospiraceae bacterium]|nr:SMI1/KNR4 family protein [Oscillospiraceae bacterium]